MDRCNPVAFIFQLSTFNFIFAGMMELADMQDLGSCALALGFKSPCPHHVGASSISLAPTFLIEPAPLGFDFIQGAAGDLTSAAISILIGG